MDRQGRTTPLLGPGEFRDIAMSPAGDVLAYEQLDEVAGTRRGMMIAIPEEVWSVFRGLTAAAFGGVLLDLAGGVSLSPYRKQVRGPKRPPPKRESGAKVKHVSTAKLLEKRKGST